MVYFKNGYLDYTGKLIRMTESYPIYDDEDDTKIIGHTEVGDMGVITYSNAKDDYHEVIIVSGKYIGVDTLALNNNDLVKSEIVKGEKNV